MNKIMLMFLSAFSALIVANMGPSAYAHDDGTMHIHVKGTLKARPNNTPIAGAQLDLNSVRSAFILPPDPWIDNRVGRDYAIPRIANSDAVQCLSDVVAATNPTNANGYYEVIVKFKYSYDFTMNVRDNDRGASHTEYYSADCRRVAEFGKFNHLGFRWTKEGLSEITALP